MEYQKLFSKKQKYFFMYDGLCRTTLIQYSHHKESKVALLLMKLEIKANIKKLGVVTILPCLNIWQEKATLTKPTELFVKELLSCDTCGSKKLQLCPYFLSERSEEAATLQTVNYKLSIWMLKLLFQQQHVNYRKQRVKCSTGDHKLLACLEIMISAYMRLVK